MLSTGSVCCRSVDAAVDAEIVEDFAVSGAECPWPAPPLPNRGLESLLAVVLRCELLEVLSEMALHEHFI